MKLYGASALRLTVQAFSKDSQPKYRQVKCKVCNGNGWSKNDSPSVRCKKCNGTGWRLFPEGRTENCPSCSGRGLDYRFALVGNVCQECDGFGEIKVLI